MRVAELNKALLVPLLLAGAVSCTGGGGGIGGSGVVAQGTITAFGSIFVNGIEFETGSAQISIDEAAGGEGDLRLGMVVTVSGTLSDDGTTGEAGQIVYDDSIEGSISGFVVSASGDRLTLTVLGNTVLAERGGTVFDGAGFDFDSVALDDVVRVSGFRLDGDVLAATRIEKTMVFVPGTTEFEISGTIAGFSGNAFSIGGFAVSLDGTTELPDGGLADGLFVEVEGVMQSAATGIAREIELEDDGLPDDADEVEIQGVVSAFTSLADFMIGAVRVDASAAEFEPLSLRGSIRAGSRVEIEGALQGGVLIAEEVKGRGGEVEIHAPVIAISLANRTVELELAPSQSVVVTTNNQTLFDDDVDSDAFKHADIQVDDYLNVRGYQQGTGVIATDVQRRNPRNKLRLQGIVEQSSYSAPNGTITVLGVTFGTDANTDFDDQAVDFYSHPGVVARTAVVKLEDGDSDSEFGLGTADKVELEEDDD